MTPCAMTGRVMQFTSERRLDRIVIFDGIAPRRQIAFTPIFPRILIGIGIALVILIAALKRARARFREILGIDENIFSRC